MRKASALIGFYASGAWGRPRPSTTKRTEVCHSHAGTGAGLQVLERKPQEQLLFTERWLGAVLALGLHAHSHLSKQLARGGLRSY